MTELHAVHRVRAVSTVSDEELEVPFVPGAQDDLDDGWCERCDQDEDDCTCGRIVGFSGRSRARMMYRLSTLEWAEAKGIPEMVTLTYPADFPTDGPTVKRHLHAFAESWRRRFGQPFGCWKLEFQRRGAPHFHLYVMRPHMAWREFLDWARETWHRVTFGCHCAEVARIVLKETGERRPVCAHADQGVRLDRQFVSAARSVKKIAGYFAKHNAKAMKHYQNNVPDGFESVGRFWGVWGFKSSTVDVELTTQEFVQLRRFLVALQSKNGRKRKAPSRLIGCWTLAHDAPGVAAKMLVWLDALPSRTAPARGRLSLARTAPFVPD